MAVFLATPDPKPTHITQDFLGPFPWGSLPRPVYVQVGSVGLLNTAVIIFIKL